MPCDPSLEAATLIEALTVGGAFGLPVPDLDDPVFQVPATVADRMYAKVVGPQATDLTSGTVGGAGVFDRLMASVRAHIQDEYARNRITGAEYTRAYIELTQAAMASAVQFTLGKEQAFWQAQTAQVAAITGRVGLENAKAEALTSRAALATAKIRTATEGVTYCSGKYNLEFTLPAQLGLVQAQTAGQASQTLSQDYTRANILPAQKNLVTEQAEAARGQTSNIRLDGAGVNGVLGKQRDLLDTQAITYQRDMKLKVAKVHTDAWNVQKAVDDGLTPPTGFTNSVIDSVLTALRVENGF